MSKVYQGWRFNADAGRAMHDIMAEIYPNDKYCDFDWLIVADTEEKALETAKEYSSISSLEIKEFGNRFYAILMPPDALSDAEMDEFLERLK